jgi:biotin-dependent carboxylase-like uncharacterized protein
MIEVAKSGLQATVQDGGRTGFLSKGIPCSGAQDSYALRVASLLVGNRVPSAPLSGEDPGDAGLEFLLQGPTLRFSEQTVVAITGAELQPTLDGSEIPMWETVTVPPGSVLDLGRTFTGARGYLAVAGGLDLPRYLGSRSTYLPANLGGFEGRALRAGDRLPTGSPRRPLSELAGRRMSEEARGGGPAGVARVVLGPQAHLFTDEAVATFLSTRWRLSPLSDRMGFRFEGPELTFKPRPAYLDAAAGSDPSNVVDDVTPLGGIQVPGGVEPIVMGVDFPSVGGYAKIATVISADLGKIGQLRPGGQVEFQSVDLDAADEAARLKELSLDETWLITATES